MFSKVKQKQLWYRKCADDAKATDQSEITNLSHTTCWSSRLLFFSYFTRELVRMNSKTAIIVILSLAGMCQAQDNMFIGGC